MGLMKSFILETRDFLSGFSAPDNFFGLGGFAPTAANVTVNEMTAMQSSTVFGCIRIVAGSVAALPFHVYEKLPTGGRRIAKDHPLEYLLSTRPSDELDAYMAKETALVHLLTRGNCYFLKLRNPHTKKVTQLDLLSPFSTTVYRNGNDGALIYKFIGWDNKEHTFLAEDIIHVRGVSWDGIVGMSPIQQFAREAIGLDLGLRNYGARFIANGASASAMLSVKSKISPADRKQLETDVVQAHTGTNAHRAIVVGAEATWQPLGISPEQAQFLQTRGFQRGEICAIYGVPAHLVGDHEQTKAGVSEQNALLLNTTLVAWLKRIEAAFNVKFFSNNPRYSTEDASRYEIGFDTAKLERYEFESTLSKLATGRQWGLITSDEGREFLGLNPFDKQDSDNPAEKLWRPVNMMPISEESEETPVSPTAKEEPEASKPSDTASEADELLARSLYQRVFKDAFNRVFTREKRDEKHTIRVFSAPLETIADYFCMEQRDDFRSGDTLPGKVDTFVQEYTRTLAKRAVTWKSEDVYGELTRAIKALKQATTKEVTIEE